MSRFIPAFNFGFLSPFYDSLVNVLGYGLNQRAKVLKLLELKPGEKLLDIGCGTGSFLVLVKQKYPNNEIVGLDHIAFLEQICLEYSTKIASRLQVKKGECLRI